MSSYNLLESLLGEAKEEETDDAVADPVDSDTDDSNKDIESDNKDSASDNDDVDPASDDTDSEDDTSDDQSDSADDGNDTSTSEPFADDSSQNKEKKLLLYKALKDIKNSFDVTMTALDELITSDLPETNSSTLTTIRKKVLTNIDLLEELLGNIDIAKAKSYEDMLVLYNIYKGDLQLVEVNLRYFVRALSKK